MMGNNAIVCPCAIDFRGYNDSAPFGVIYLKFSWFHPNMNCQYFMYFRFNGTNNRLVKLDSYDMTFSNSLTTTDDNKGLSLTGAKNLKDLIDDLQSQITALATKVDTQELDINGTKVLYDDGN